MEMKTAVITSDEGNLLRVLHKSKITGIRLSLVVTDRKCGAYDAAYNSLKIPRAMVKRNDFSPAFDQHRPIFTAHLLRVLKLNEIQLVLFAGLRTIVSPNFFQEYGGLTLSIHRSLLPAFPGLNPVRRALEAGAKVTGSTVHTVAERKVDEGRIIDRVVVPIRPDDTVEKLTARIEPVEYELLPRAIRKFQLALQ